MWENFKKKITNFIYEEVEEELIEDPNKNEKNQKDTLEEKEKKIQAARQKDNQDVKTRMTFKYPKNDSESFKFPVIPDESGDKVAADRPVLSSERAEERSRQGASMSQPAFIRKRKQTRPTQKRSHTGYTPSVYEQKRREEELENIPAYERRQSRRRSPEHEDESADFRGNEQEWKDTREKEKLPEWTKMSYSKPDELDAVFNRADKLDEKAETSYKQEDHQVAKTGNYEQVIKDEAYFAKDIEALHPKANISAAELEPTREDELTERTEDAGTEASANLAWQEEGQDNFQAQSSSRIASPRSEMQEEDELSSRARNKRHSYKPVEVPHHLLDDVTPDQTNNRDWLHNQKHLLKQTLEHFNIDAEIVAATVGPTVTRLEIQPALGVKVSRIRNLADDIKMNLAARDIRIEAPIPGKNTVGIEIPNEEAEMVHFQEMIESEAFKNSTSPLTVALGLTIEGDPYITDISKMPHGLIAGATGSGKSVCINTMILSLLYKAHFDDVKLMMIDPKMVELTQYNGIPHLLTPVITDAKAATVALKWAVDEMERRYELFVEHQVRNIKRYNRKVTEESLPYIVIIIDELADLMLVSPQEVEDYISRIAQKARAAGIHLILATQRPSVDVITGLIKANIPSRIAFAVSSQVDSRTILDGNGAEKLLGKGDMLFIENGVNKQLRLQGPFVSDEEIDRVVHYLRSIAEPEYFFEHEELFIQLEVDAEDELFEEVVEFVLNEQRASTSLLQRRFRIGYNRAARLIDAMHERGIISAQNGSRPREVLITKAQWEQNVHKDMNT
ncbi:MAG TPA: DNA translocase FtsK [Pseudogracilibacillus sp.]|nr:DNA translocase FtsK [Pseudogracilibacillus sp.]